MGIPIRERCSYCGEADHHQGNCPDWVRDEISRLSQKHKREHEARLTLGRAGGGVICPMCQHVTPCENNPCGLRNNGQIRRPGDPVPSSTQSVPGRMTFTVLERGRE